MSDRDEIRVMLGGVEVSKWYHLAFRPRYAGCIPRVSLNGNAVIVLRAEGPIYRDTGPTSDVLGEPYLGDGSLEVLVSGSVAGIAEALQRGDLADVAQLALAAADEALDGLVTRAAHVRIEITRQQT